MRWCGDVAMCIMFMINDRQVYIYSLNINIIYQQHRQLPSERLESGD